MRCPYERGSISGRFLSIKIIYYNFDMDIENCPPYLLARCRYYGGVRKYTLNYTISAFFI